MPEGAPAPSDTAASVGDDADQLQREEITPLVVWMTGMVTLGMCLLAQSAVPLHGVDEEVVIAVLTWGLALWWMVGVAMAVALGITCFRGPAYEPPVGVCGVWADLAAHRKTWPARWMTFAPAVIVVALSSAGVLGALAQLESKGLSDFWIGALAGCAGGWVMLTLMWAAAAALDRLTRTRVLSTVTEA